MRNAMILCLLALAIVAGAWYVHRAEPAPVAGRTTATLPPVHMTVSARVPLAAPGPTPLDDPPARAPGAKTLTSVEWTRQLRDAMCACADAACVRDTDLRYRSMPAQFSPEDRDVVRRTIQESSRCQQRILDGRPPNG